MEKKFRVDILDFEVGFFFVMGVLIGSYFLRMSGFLFVFFCEVGIIIMRSFDFWRWL